MRRATTRLRYCRCHAYAAARDVELRCCCLRHYACLDGLRVFFRAGCLVFFATAPVADLLRLPLVSLIMPARRLSRQREASELSEV